MQKLEKLTEIRTGFFTKPEANGKVVCYHAKHFDESGKLTTTPYPDIALQSVSEKHLLQNGDVLFAAKGDKNFATVINIAQYAAVASTSFFVIHLTTDAVLPEYLAWFLNHHTTQAFLKSKARGTAIASIRKSDLVELEMPVPSLDKQRHILQIAELATKEIKLRNEVQQLRTQLIDQQILNSIN